MTSDTIRLMFDGVLEDCIVEHDKNGEVICYSKTGRFIKFPNGSDLAIEADKHNMANSIIPVFAKNVVTRKDSIPLHITKAVAIDRKTGAEYILGTKVRSYCHFFDRVPYEGYEIGLRLDWKQIDLNGDPTLDADFFPPGSSKPDKAMKASPAHNISKSVNSSSGEIAYEFQYQSLHLNLIVQTTNARTISGCARIVK